VKTTTRITYKSHLIIRWDTAYLCDPETKGYQYDVYAIGKTNIGSSAVESTKTLREAKWYVDRMIAAGGDDWTLANDFGI
jgi:hypothetical protein